MGRGVYDRKASDSRRRRGRGGYSDLTLLFLSKGLENLHPGLGAFVLRLGQLIIHATQRQFLKMPLHILFLKSWAGCSYRNQQSIEVFRWYGKVVIFQSQYIPINCLPNI